MKKIFIISILTLFSICIQAQSEVKLVTYEITTSGVSNGLDIPSPFYISVTKYALTGVLNADKDYSYISYLKTYTDTSNIVTLVNDSVPEQIYFLENKPAAALFNTTVTQYLNGVYGAQNVKVIE